MYDIYLTVKQSDTIYRDEGNPIAKFLISEHETVHRYNSNGVTFNGSNGLGDTNYVNFQTGELGAYNRGGNLYLGGSYTTTWQGGDYPYPFYPNIFISFYFFSSSALL